MIDHHGANLSKQHGVNLEVFMAHSKICHYQPNQLCKIARY